MTELERALARLGRELEVPATPDLVPGVLAGLGTRPARAPRFAGRRWALAVAAVVLAALLATLAIPDARSALLRVLHLGGEQIVRVDELPTVGTAAEGLDLDVVLGRRTTLARAREEAGFRLRELDRLPDRVYLGPRGTIWFLYGTPQDVRLLVAQSPRTRVDEELLVMKLVASGTRVDTVSVGGAPAYFLSGEPHVVLLLDENGDPVEEAAWLARNVLVWEKDGVAYRLEGAFTKDEALELADSLR